MNSLTLTESGFNPVSAVNISNILTYGISTHFRTCILTDSSLIAISLFPYASSSNWRRNIHIAPCGMNCLATPSNIIRFRSLLIRPRIEAQHARIALFTWRLSISANLAASSIVTSASKYSRSSYLFIRFTSIRSGYAALGIKHRRFNIVGH